MAFGDLKGTLSGNDASTTAANAISGSVAVVAGDLVFVTFANQTSLTATTCSDNLGNTYTATNAGTDAGTASGRSYYSYVTNAGTLTAVTVVATASGVNWAGAAAVIEGPFKSSPLDANPANITNDTSSPFTCPATGTLAQADEVIIAWASANNSGVAGTWSATSPNIKAVQATDSGDIMNAVIGYQLVAATTTVSPAWTSGTAPGSDVLGTSTFMKGVGGVSATPTPGSLVLTGQVPTIAATAHVSVSPAPGSLVLISQTPTILTPRSVSPAAGSLVLTGNVPTITVAVNISVLPGAGSLVLTGNIPGVATTANLVVTPSPGSLVLTGKTPATMVTVSASPGTGGLVLTGKIPTVTATALVVVSPGLGSLVLAGYIPSVQVTGPISFNITVGQGARLSPSVSTGASMSPSVSGNANLTYRLER